MLMVPFEGHEPRELLLSLLNRTKEPLVGIETSVNVSTVSSSFIALGPFVIRAEAGHVSPVPYVDNDIGFDVCH
jgi:hypothetical protein